MRKASTLALIVSTLMLISPLALKADATSPQNFTISIFAGAPGDYASSLINQFNPALGTLTGFQATLSGSTTWTTAVAGDSLSLSLSDTNATQFFSESAIGSYPINISLSGSNSSSGVLSYWTGTGFNTFTLSSGSDTDINDTFSAATLNGTLTYYYTPSPVPEPASVLLLGTGLLGLAVLFGFKKRAA